MLVIIPAKTECMSGIHFIVYDRNENMLHWYLFLLMYVYVLI